MKARKLALHIEGRITSQDDFVLSHLLGTLLRPGIVTAEIGSFLGNGSTKAIINSIKGAGGILYCIDTWHGNRNVDWHLRLAEEYDLYHTFLHNVAAYGGQNIVNPVKMSSNEAAACFDDRYFDLIFIDGDHSYESTKSDIEKWICKVRRGGILCGHDCEGAMSDFNSAIIDTEIDKDFISLEKYIFAGVHPGVVKAVDELFNGTATLWAHKDLIEHGINGRSSIWHIVI